MVNSKTLDCPQADLHMEHWNLVVVCLFLAVHTCHHKCSPAACQCSLCQTSWKVMWQVCRFCLPLGVDWEEGSLALIFNNFEPKPDEIFFGLTPLPQGDRMIQLFNIVGSKMW